MAQKVTYSFLDVLAALVGPGGSVQLGSGAGVAEEGLDFEPSEDLNTMSIGADGSVAHSLHADKSGTITVRLLKTSPQNSVLQAMLQFQRTSSANHGQNTLTIVNKVSGDVITAQAVAFSKQPPINYAKDARLIEWTFHAGIVDPALGKGL